MYRVTLYKDAGGEWLWRMKAANGLIVADSAEGYASRSGAKRAAVRMIDATKVMVP